MFPQAVYFPIRTLYLTLKIEQRERYKSGKIFANVSCLNLFAVLSRASTITAFGHLGQGSLFLPPISPTASIALERRRCINEGHSSRNSPTLSTPNLHAFRVFQFPLCITSFGKFNTVIQFSGFRCEEYVSAAFSGLSNHIVYIPRSANAHSNSSFCLKALVSY